MPSDFGSEFSKSLKSIGSHNMIALMIGNLDVHKFVKMNRILNIMCHTFILIIIHFKSNFN